MIRALWAGCEGLAEYVARQRQEEQIEKFTADSLHRCQIVGCGAPLGPKARSDYCPRCRNCLNQRRRRRVMSPVTRF